MPKNKTTSKKSKTTSSQYLTLAALGIAAVLGLIFLVTGADPLGLFTPTNQAPSGGSETGSGGWWQVYFTDPTRINNPDDLKGSIPEKLIAYIDSAHETIDIAAFEFDLTPVAQALIEAQRRGVQVRWITDDENGLEVDGEDGHGQFAMLEKAGIPVRDDGRTALMHNKFLIFDSHIVWTGSTNLTRNGNFRNNNNVIVIDSRPLAAIYQREFEEMWAGEFGPRSPSTLSQQALTIDSTHIQVYFASEDEVINHLIPMVQSAKKSLHIMAFSFTQDDLTQAVLDRAEAGIAVQAIFETRGSETEYSALRPLYCAGIPARQDGNPGTFHHKVIVIDGQTVITGSLNFSENADSSNDENTIILTNPEIAAQYLAEFDRRWAEASAPSATAMSCK